MPVAPQLTVVHGPNGTGKTSVLEAVHYLCMARGFAPDRDVLQHAENFFMVEGLLVAQNELSEVVQQRIQCSYLEGKGKKVLVDGTPLPRLAQHIGQVPIVAVLPNDTDLIREGATERRRWMDALLSQQSPHYLQALIQYDKALAQRNAVLQSGLQQGRAHPDDVRLWNPHLVHHGMLIQTVRAEFMEAFAALFHQVYAFLSQSAETPGLAYQPAVALNTTEGWEKQLAASLTADTAAGRTTTGTHKDDWLFSLQGRPLKNYGSQGQHKTYVLALKLAQHAYLKTATAKNPILLLDDIFERLDAHRSAQLFAWLAAEERGADTQVLVTDTTDERTRRALAGVPQLQATYVALRR